MTVPKAAAKARRAACQIHPSKCPGGHVSMDGPERPGMARDGCTAVVKFMGPHVVNLTDDQAEMTIDLLFNPRTGIEKQAG